MDQPKRNINSSSVERATDCSLDAGRRLVADALAFSSDADKKTRVTKSLCRWCFYRNKHRIGGAAMTNQPCGVCSVNQMYGSTATNMICTPCGIENELCVQCGADVHLRSRRKYEVK